MTHERSTELGDITLYINCCEYCPYCVEHITFKSVIDKRYDKKEWICEKTRTKITNRNLIPIECPLPPRSKY